MAASEHLHPALFHGTRAVINGKDIYARGMLGQAWASDDPESAREYGRTKLPEGEVGPLKVYQVTPIVKDMVEKSPHPTREGVNNYSTPLGFRIVGEHKFEDE